VKILAHPIGHLIDRRDPHDLDMLAIVRKCKAGGIALELNTHPERLDLIDLHCRMAKDEGALVSISSDAHSMHDFDHLMHGIGQARRGWLEKSDVLNTRMLKDLRTWPALRR
jgi:DNA polymerase (family 10)